ncbi:osteoclast stimulating factor 1 [Fimicolochytrium jonesii]|uniref:osteoclast stimulating factor 1 n=1 Tax=Fimicolochytrium jonesii TaxID=1396493 RepID=UPI0022FE6056|nr:osteoclast stimulating factor 1 [Fimicolochytrium jonesii]KAI8823444.1 osteoclast stimulating factor 1 [Fimicolochytrium jonesii]
MAPPPPRPSRPGKKEISVVRALYDYAAQRPDELSFQEGDVLYVLNKDEEHWWKCRCNDKEGFVPKNYVGENTAEIDNPLHEAAKRGNLGFAKELLSAGVSVNALDKAGNSPLHWASRGGHADVVRCLLDYKPAINAQNKLGDSPLHLASWGGHTAVVQLLISQPTIDTRLKNNDGKTSVDLAKSDETAAFLMQAIGAGYASGMVEDEEDEDD